MHELSQSERGQLTASDTYQHVEAQRCTCGCREPHQEQVDPPLRARAVGSQHEHLPLDEVHKAWQAVVGAAAIVTTGAMCMMRLTKRMRGEVCSELLACSGWERGGQGPIRCRVRGVRTRRPRSCRRCNRLLPSWTPSKNCSV